MWKRTPRPWNLPLLAVVTIATLLIYGGVWINRGSEQTIWIALLGAITAWGLVDRWQDTLAARRARLESEASDSAVKPVAQNPDSDWP